MSRVASLARTAVRWEVAVWVGLARWLARRPAVPDGAVPFGYARQVTPLFWLFIAVSAVEVPVAHVLLPWHTAQVVSLVVGLWGLVWMLGMLAGLHVHPHLVTPDALHVRDGSHLHVVVPWAAVRAVRAVRRDLPSQRSVQLTDGDDGRVLHVVVGSQTAVDVLLSRPTEVALPKGPATVTQVRLHADDPGALVTAARAALSSAVDAQP